MRAHSIIVGSKLDFPCIFPVVYTVVFNLEVTVSWREIMSNDLSIGASSHTVALADQLIWWVIWIVSPQGEHDVVCATVSIGLNLVYIERLLPNWISYYIIYRKGAQDSRFDVQGCIFAGITTDCIVEVSGNFRVVVVSRFYLNFQMMSFLEIRVMCL